MSSSARTTAGFGAYGRGVPAQESASFPEIGKRGEVPSMADSIASLREAAKEVRETGTTGPRLEGHLREIHRLEMELRSHGCTPGRGAVINGRIAAAAPERITALKYQAALGEVTGELLDDVGFLHVSGEVMLPLTQSLSIEAREKIARMAAEIAPPDFVTPLGSSALRQS